MIKWKNLKNRLKEERTQKGLLAMDILIAILCIVCACSLWFMISELREYGNYTYDDSSFFYNMQSGNYSTMVEMTNQNRTCNAGGNAVLQEYYAVSDYFEAVIYYNSYANAKDDERAEKWKNRMEEAAEAMGKLSAEKQKIDAILRLE